MEEGRKEIKAYTVGDTLKEFTLGLGDMTEDEREIILEGLSDQLLQIRKIKYKAGAGASGSEADNAVL